MASKSCLTCPSCIHAADVPVHFKKAVTNADVCLRTGNILSRPGQSDSENERIKIEFAAKCPMYGEAQPAKAPAFLTAQVGIGDPEVIGRMASMVVDPADRPTTCAGCANFIPSDVIHTELGWNLGMCSAKGRLLFAKNMTDEAASCGVGLKGTPRDNTVGVILFPEYDMQSSLVGVSVSRSSGPRDYNKDRVDPRTYVTDKPVTDDDRDACIRAWRRVIDPEGMRQDLFLPIFDGLELCGFDPRTTYGNHRPDLYIDYQNLLYDLTALMHGSDEVANDETPLLIGGAGEGKTEAACWYAWLMDLPFHRIPVRGDSEARELVGTTQLLIDEATGLQVTRFVPGRITRHFGTPCVLDVDELNMSSEIAALTRPMFDSARQLFVEEANLMIEKSGYCFPILTQNPSDDPKYVGTQPLSAADWDRLMPIVMIRPPENVEREIILTHMVDAGVKLPTKTLDQIMQIATDIRALIDNGTLPIAWGLRAQIKVARASAFFSLEKAYRRALVDGMEAEQADLVLAVVRSVAS